MEKRNKIGSNIGWNDERKNRSEDEIEIGRIELENEGKSLGFNNERKLGERMKIGLVIDEEIKNVWREGMVDMGEFEDNRF